MENLMPDDAVIARRGRSKARFKFAPLTEPNPVANMNIRNEWIEGVCSGFVQPSTANKNYYRIVLETLWPDGHGIPGPIITEPQIRRAIDKFRKSKLKAGEEIEPYRDPFRRVRELMGEEGVTGIGKQGRSYQLVNTSLGEKRIPRTHLSDSDWELVVSRCGRKCPVCNRSEPEIKFDQDHKIPRSRGGADDLENWQALCIECNNSKSMACRGCKFDCLKCGWAFPELFAPLRLSAENLQAVKALAEKLKCDPHILVNNLLDTQIKILREREDSLGDLLILC